MAISKFRYDGNKSVYDSTSVLQVGGYAARQGEVLPIPKAEAESLDSLFVLTPAGDSDITATKVSDHEELKDLIGEVTEEVSPTANTLVQADPEGDSASSPSEGNLKGGTGSGGGK